MTIIAWRPEMTPTRLSREVSLCYYCEKEQATHHKQFKAREVLCNILLCDNCVKLTDIDLSKWIFPETKEIKI